METIDLTEDPSRPSTPTPSLASDDGADSCDEVEEGIFEGEDRDSDVEVEDSNDIEDQIIEELKEIKQEQKLEKGKGKETEETDENDLIIMEAKAKAVVLPGYIRINEFESLLREKPRSNGLARAELKLAKSQAKAALASLRSSYEQTSSILSTSAEVLFQKLKRPLKLSEFPRLPPASDLGPPPILPFVQYPAPLHNLPANGSRDLVAAGGEGGGGGGGGAIELDATTQDTGSTETCPGGEDVQVEENAGMNILAAQLLVEGKESTDHFFSPFPPKTPLTSLVLANYDPTTHTLSPRHGLLTTSTTELFKGNVSSYRYHLSNFSLYRLEPNFVKAVKSRCPSGAKLYYNILDSRQATRRFGPGHFSANRSHFRLFSKHGRAVAAVEVRWKIKTNGELSLRHYIWTDSSMIDVKSMSVEFEKQNFVEGKKRRGVRVPSGTMEKVEKWRRKLSKEVQVHVDQLANHSPRQNPFITPPPSTPTLSSDSIVSSTSFAPSSLLKPGVHLSSFKMPSKTTIYHNFQRRLITEFASKCQLDSLIRGGTVMKNSEGEEVQIESAFGITESLGKLGELLELSSGGLVLANEVATVHVALPRGAGSKYRVIHHKTLPYQAVLIVQDYFRDKPQYHGSHVFMCMSSWTSNRFAETSLSSILILHSYFDKPAIIGGEYWLAKRAACSHDPHRQMGLLSLSKPFKRHSRKMEITLDDEAPEGSGSLRGLVTKWQPLLQGEYIEVPLSSTDADVFYFYLPFSNTLSRQRNLPSKSIRIAFSKKVRPDGTLPLGLQLAQQDPRPSKIRLYCDSEIQLSCSFDNSSKRHLLDENNITSGSLGLMNYAKWIIFDEIDEGRMVGLQTEISSSRIKEMTKLAKEAYESLIGIGSTKEAVNKRIFKDRRFPYLDGYPVWLHKGCFVNFDGLDKSVPSPQLKALNSLPRFGFLGHPVLDKNDYVPDTLYFCYRREGKTKSAVWVKGETATGEIDVKGTDLWSKTEEDRVMKAVMRCEELHEAMLQDESSSKRRRTG